MGQANLFAKTSQIEEFGGRKGFHFPGHIGEDAREDFADELGSLVSEFHDDKSAVIASDMAAQTLSSVSGSRPGNTKAPCGSLATSCMKRAVVPRDPVEPATITGCCGGLASHNTSSR